MFYVIDAIEFLIDRTPIRARAVISETETHVMEMGYEEKNGFVLMLNTAKNDINHNQIYEGDIVKATYYKHREKNLQLVQTVYYNLLNACFGLLTLKQGDNGMPEWEESYLNCPLSWANKLEVIGNIYETPEKIIV